MPRHKDNDKLEKADFKAIVQLPLLDDFEEDLVEWDKLSPDTVWSYLDDFLLAGHSFELKAHADHDGTITCIAKGFYNVCENAGYWFYSDGGDALEALSTMLFKHVIICGGRKWTDKEVETKKRRRR